MRHINPICIGLTQMRENFVSSALLEDYHNLKPRKCNDRRQRFLVAMQACPFITYLKEESSKEEKYYKIQMHGTLPVNAADEIEVFPSNENMDVQTSQITHTSEDGSAAGVANMGNYVCHSHSENDLDNHSSPLLVDSNYSLPDDIAQLLSNLGDSDVNLTIPDAITNELKYPENGASFLNNSIHLTRSPLSCDQTLNFTDEFNLPAKEQSYSFELRAENDFPINYDPVNDLIQSIGTPKPVEMEAIPKTNSDQLGNVQMIPEISEEFCKCEFEGVFRIDDNDGIVKRLQRNRVSGDNHEKHYYMMVLKPKTM
ncbi:uncharacterized protein LOC129981743 isoform X2 [Argiope bruennichi]|uniref:uncharacterized protein LOC129981743 isoform X2 n=1 Tax=Argiope bruennichi TaxID=94029 RepID=UPI002494F591|nr:uncharacterized protein LOC129981743 isoform X2 [Argiope bruennichi]